jgi:TatA/E family protein of Tat protein translocase
MLRAEWELEMFGFGPSELILFSVVALLLFGKRLPGAMRSLGEGIREFKTTVRDTTAGITDETV